MHNPDYRLAEAAQAVDVGERHQSLINPVEHYDICRFDGRVVVDPASGRSSGDPEQPLAAQSITQIYAEPFAQESRQPPHPADRVHIAGIGQCVPCAHHHRIFTDPTQTVDEPQRDRSSPTEVVVSTQECYAHDFLRGYLFFAGQEFREICDSLRCYHFYDIDPCRDCRRTWVDVIYRHTLAHIA